MVSFLIEETRVRQPILAKPRQIGQTKPIVVWTPGIWYPTTPITYNNPTISSYSGKYGAVASYKFDSADTETTPRRLEWPDAPWNSPTGAITLICAFNLRIPPSRNNKGLISKYVGSPTTDRAINLYLDYQTHASNNYIKLAISSNGSSATTSPAGIHVASGIHCVVATYIPSTSITVWLDGVLYGQNTTSIPSAIYNSTAPLWIGNQYSLTAGGGNSIYVPSADISLAALYSGAINPDMALDISVNPWQIFTPKETFVYISVSGITLTGVSTSNTAASSSGSISQIHIIPGSNSNQTSSSSTGTINQSITLSGADSGQSSQGTAGSIIQTHILTGNSVTETATSPGAAVIIDGTVILTGTSSTESHGSSAGAVSQIHFLLGANTISSNASTTAAIAQTHVLSGDNSSQAASSPGNSLESTNQLTGTNNTQTSSSSSGLLEQTHIIIGNSSNQSAISTQGSIGQTNILSGNNSIQSSLSAGNPIIIEGSLLGTNVTQSNSSSSGVLTINLGDFTGTGRKTLTLSKVQDLSLILTRVQTATLTMEIL